MNAQNEFDELARRKLAEQRPSFVESDWTAMEQLLHRKKKRRGGWLFRSAIGVGALALIGGTWWALHPPRTTSGTVTGAERTERSAELSAKISENAPQASDVEVPGNKTNDTLSSATTSSSARLEQLPIKEPMGMQPDPSALIRKASSVGNTNEPALPTTPSFDPPAATTQVTDRPTLAGSATLTTDIDPLVEYVDPAFEGPTSSSGATFDNKAPSDGPPAAITGRSLDGVPPHTSDLDDRSFSSADTTTINDPASVAAPIVLSTTNDTLPAVKDDRAKSDGTSMESTLVTAEKPWQFSMLLGESLSTSSYTGGHSEKWNSGSRGRWTAMYGAEVMRMGDHFGFGSGLHYSTYEEDLVLDERSLITTELRDSNYFESFDTTLLYVIGNVIIDGQEWYVTETVDTTITYLVTTTGSFLVNRRLSDALTARNRVSYLELPLLIDGHLTRGPWTIGLRGGPTIGVVSGRRGTVPNAGYDDYEPYADKAFRSPVLGVTGRAYIRYAFSNGWGIGVEPTFRRHFGNAFGVGDLVRTNSSIGGMVSVTYRMRR